MVAGLSFRQEDTCYPRLAIVLHKPVNLVDRFVRSGCFYVKVIHWELLCAMQSNEESLLCVVSSVCGSVFWVVVNAWFHEIVSEVASRFGLRYIDFR